MYNFIIFTVAFKETGFENLFRIILEADTIGGFNSMLEKQSKEEGEAYISTVLFDDQSEVLYDRVPVGKVEPMNDNQYY